MNSPKLYAVLDVGSNSVRLLVAKEADGRAICLHAQKVTTRLYAGMGGGMLAQAAIDRTADAIALLAGVARDMGAQRVAAFGTSAMRDGANRGELIARARAVGVDLQVLSGAQEADLAYAGAAPAGRKGVVDIGGGSTELLAGQDGRPLATYSAQMGAVRLYDMMAGKIHREKMLTLAGDALAPAWAALAHCPVDGWVGVGGTITTLAAMCLSLSPYDPEAVQGYALTKEKTLVWFDRLCGLDLEARKAIPGLSAQRADIIPYGAAIALAFFRLSGAKMLLASDRDNLLGYVEKYLMKEG